MTYKKINLDTKLVNDAIDKSLSLVKGGMKNHVYLKRLELDKVSVPRKAEVVKWWT